MLGLSPDGKPIVPKFDNVLDDPRRHTLYFDHATWAFLTTFLDSKGQKPLNVEPAYPRMIRAGFYDGLGTMLPLGAYWIEQIRAWNQNFWSMKKCFDIFPTPALEKPDDEMQEYMRSLQMDKYGEHMTAFRAYLRERQDKSGRRVEFVMPDYGITSDGEIVKLAREPAPRRWTPGFGGADADDPDGEPKERYWYHSESDSLFVTKAGEPDPRTSGSADGALVEELSKDEYNEIEHRHNKPADEDIFDI